jgi:hypothetical protein
MKETTYRRCVLISYIMKRNCNEIKIFRYNLDQTLRSYNIRKNYKLMLICISLTQA